MQVYAAKSPDNGAQPDLDKDQCTPFAHDEIDFAHAAAEISGYEFEAGVTQVLLGKAFSRFTARGHSEALL
jgi:hypothetical protein